MAKESFTIDEVKEIIKRIVKYKKQQIGDDWNINTADSVAYILYYEFMRLEDMALEFVDEYSKRNGDPDHDIEEDFANSEEATEEDERYLDYRRTRTEYIPPTEYSRYE